MERWSLALWLAVALIPGRLAATDGAPKVHALTGVRIVVAPGKTIDRGVVVFRDGVLEAVGAGIEPPPDARIWERDGLTVYPGLIDPYTVRPWPAAGKGGGEGPGGTEGGAGNGLVLPERDMAIHAVDADAAGKLRAAGYTTAVVAPEQGLFRGSSALVNLGDRPAGASLLRRDVAQNVTWRTNPPFSTYPASRMGAVALFRQTLLDAGWYRRARAAWERHPDQARPPLDVSLEALTAAAAGEQPLVIETEEVAEALRAASLAAELGLKAWLVGNGDEYRRLDPVAATGLPVILPLAFPEAPKAGEEDDLTVDLDELRHWDQAPENPKRLLDAGLTVAFTTYRLDDPKKIHANLARAIERGLTAEEALAAVTTTSARLLGVERIAGTVEAGRMADLVVVDGDLFVDEPKIREVWIDGERYEVEAAKEPDDEKKEEESPERRLRGGPASEAAR